MRLLRFLLRPALMMSMLTQPLILIPRMLTSTLDQAAEFRTIVAPNAIQTLPSPKEQRLTPVHMFNMLPMQQDLGQPSFPSFELRLRIMPPRLPAGGLVLVVTTTPHEPSPPPKLIGTAIPL